MSHFDFGEHFVYYYIMVLICCIFMFDDWSVDIC